MPTFQIAIESRQQARDIVFECETVDEIAAWIGEFFRPELEGQTASPATTTMLTVAVISNPEPGNQTGTTQ